MYLYRHRRIRLMKVSRVVGPMVVTFRIVKDSYRFFGGLVAYEVRRLEDDFEACNVPQNILYVTMMELKAARYTILSRCHDKMLAPA